MNTRILDNTVQDFINTHLKSDVHKLILKGSPFPEISVQELANQIVAKKKSEHKLPTWFLTENIFYPPKLSIEQTSSELTANYKAQLISGKSIIDLTGGFGVDTYAFSKYFDQVVHCELNPELSAIVKHNYKYLGVQNITTVATDGLEYLKNTTQKFDWIYIDPSRRNDHKGKVFLLKDCLPNVPEYLDLLFQKTDRILLKNSPILDISATINELRFVKEIHIIATNNEVKELLFILEKNYTDAITIHTVNLQKSNVQEFSFRFNDSATAQYALPKTYLYEPNSAVLKSGGFQHVAQQLQLEKLHIHSHLYTSDQLITFPGRRFTIQHILPYDRKQLRKYLPEQKANITIRNFPESVQQIRKKTKLKDGGNYYVFFTTNASEKHIVLICEQILT